MAELTKRFISGTSAQWFANEEQNKSTYANSIVFIKNNTDPTKGDMIFAQGAYFEMNNTADVENIIKNFLEGKGTGNINVEVDTDGNLTISETSIASLSGKKDSTELVQAKAVAGALTTPISLVLTPSEDATVYTFSETFTTLNGDTTEAVTAVFKEGDYIDLTNDNGLKISVDKASLATDLKTDLDYNSGNVITVNAEDRTINHNAVAETTKSTGTAINLTSGSKSFDIKSYGFDTYGHIASETTTTVTLPETAFSDNNTEYAITTTTGTATNSVDVNLVNSETDNVSSKVAIKGGDNVTVSQDGNGVITVAATADTILSGLNLSDTAVANKYVSEVDQTNGQITVTRETLPVYGVDDTTVDGLKLSLTDGKVGLVDDGLNANLTSKNVTLETAATATEGYLKTYVLKQGTKEIGKIDLPKELVVTGGEVITAEEDNAELKLVKGEKYLKLTIANQTTPVYIAVKDLVDVYTSGNGITVSDSNEISVKLHDDDKYLGFDDDKCLVTKVGELHVMDVEDSAGSNTYHSGAVVKTSGLATVENVANIINGLDSDVDARVYNEQGTGLAEFAEGEIAVVTGVTQYNGRITSVDSAAVVTKTYVDNAIEDATPATGTVSLTNGEKGSYVFAEEVAGYVTAENMAAIMNEAWSWGTI